MNNYLTLMANIESNNNEITDEIKYLITSIKSNNYIFNCEIIDQDIYNFQSAVSIITDGILLVNIANVIYKDENARVNYQKSQDGFQYISKKSKSGGISSGVLVGIILASVVVLASVIGAIIYSKKRRKKKLNKEPSSSF